MTTYITLLSYSIGARDGFTQSIFNKSLEIKQNALKNSGQLWCHWVITLGAKLKMPIFTFYLPHNLQSKILFISEDFVLGIQFQIKLTKISVTKGWSDQEVNTQIDKDLKP